MRAKALSAVLSSLVFTCAAAAQEPSKDLPRAKRFEQALNFFADLRKAYLKVIVDPAARDQAARSLRRLANRLDGLALAKEDFTRDLLKAKWPDDQARLSNQAQDLQQQGWEVRSSLSKVLEPLPNDWKKRGSEAQQALEQDLSGKWNSLNDIARDLKLPDASASTLKRESDQLIETINKIRKDVNSLIDDLTKAGTQQSSTK